MTYKDLDKRQKEVFQRNKICARCGQELTEYDDIRMIKFKVGRRYLYGIYHTSCLFEDVKKRIRIVSNRTDNLTSTIKTIV